MDIFHSVILGIVEGLTEFLPISSTFHLIFASKLLKIPDSEFLQMFEVVIQSGAILAVVILYVKELLKNRDLLKLTIVSFIPTAIIGLVLYKVIKGFFFHANWLMISVFMIVGIIFFLIEFLIKKEFVKPSKELNKLTIKDAIIIGLVQSLAVIPGVSRAGSVLVGMMILGYKREESAKYSFILAIPTILAASVLDLYKSKEVLLSVGGANFISLFIGFVVAFISAFFVMKWFIGYLKSNSLVAFGIYRIVIGIIIISWGM
ncbi:MAG: undecaprenyl-diphosphate phosphatase [Candidatus Roizmanbacteria bacterium]